MIISFKIILNITYYSRTIKKHYNFNISLLKKPINLIKKYILKIIIKTQYLLCKLLIKQNNL